MATISSMSKAEKFTELLKSEVRAKLVACLRKSRATSYVSALTSEEISQRTGIPVKQVNFHLCKRGPLFLAGVNDFDRADGKNCLCYWLTKDGVRLAK